jgi:hypothetical protein
MYIFIDVLVIQCSGEQDKNGSRNFGLAAFQPPDAAELRVLLRVHVFWDINLCRWINSSRRLEGSCGLYILAEAVPKQEKNSP